jgi:hypothetical protein
LRGSDFSILNLECAIDTGEDWPAFVGGQSSFKSPYLGAGPWVVDDLKFLGVDAVHHRDRPDMGVARHVRCRLATRLSPGARI